MRQVFLIYPALKYFVPPKSTNYSKICVKICKQNQYFFAEPQFLSNCFMFFKVVGTSYYMHQHSKKYISFSFRISICQVIPVYTWDTFWDILYNINKQLVRLFKRSNLDLLRAIKTIYFQRIIITLKIALFCVVKFQ